MVIIYVDVLFTKSLLPHPRPFPSRGRESSRTSRCSIWCGSILPLSACQSEVADRKEELVGGYCLGQLFFIERM